MVYVAVSGQGGDALNSQARPWQWDCASPCKKVRSESGGGGGSTIQNKPREGVGPKLWSAAVPRASLMQMDQGRSLEAQAPAGPCSRLCASLSMNI